MSNLIKSNYIYFDQTETKIINSNIRNDKYIPTFFNNKDENESNVSTFIDGIHPNQVKKLLMPEDELAKENAERILMEAKTKADEILNQAMLEAEERKNAIYEEARNNGYQDGYNEGTNARLELEEELRNQIHNQKLEYETMILELEPKIVDIMAALIQKITGIIIEDKKQVILHLVKNALDTSDNCKQFIIKVSREDYITLNNSKDEICSNLKDGVQIEIVEDSGLSKNQCLIETESSIIDCGLDVQYQNLLTNMKLLSNISSRESR